MHYDLYTIKCIHFKCVSLNYFNFFFFKHPWGNHWISFIATPSVLSHLINTCGIWLAYVTENRERGRNSFETVGQHCNEYYLIRSLFPYDIGVFQIIGDSVICLVFIYSGLFHPLNSKCCPWTSSKNITWESVRNAGSLAYPRPTDSGSVFFNKISKWLLGTFKFEVQIISIL